MSRFSIPIPIPNPFRKEGQFSLRDVQDEMNGMFDRLWHAGLSTGPFDGQEWAPVVDVIEETERFIVRAEVPGMEAADIEVAYSGGGLLLKGQKNSSYSEEAVAGLIRHERRFGGFSRQIALPAEVEAAKISATCRNGLLEVSLPKTEASRPQAIKIQVAE